jgi:glycerol-3-phosphate O-acyltransferase
MPFHEEIDSLVKRKKIPQFVAEIIRKFYQSYVSAVLEGGYTLDQVDPLLMQLTHLCTKQISHPYRFEPFHKRITSPFDYYRFGNDFIRPLIDMERSKVFGADQLRKIEGEIAAGENVVLLANHQIEPDPQVISILLEQQFPKTAEEMIFVAGHRVVTDPLAVPFSLGRNLLCIYSKKHVEFPPEQKAEKLMHNQRTLKKLKGLLSEGGKCIYVAPSGGRDRPNEQGKLIPADFDAQSLELFFLMAKQAGVKTHFYPLALSTYSILPPPNTVEKDIGERREAQRAPVFLHFGEEVEPEKLAEECESKQEKREKRAEQLTSIVRKLYEKLVNASHPIP